MASHSNVVIGIDLGTTNSVVSVVENGEPKVILNREGNPITPSVVSFQPNGERLVGVHARRNAVTNPTETIFSIKRFMGRRHHEVAKEEKMVPYTIVGAKDELVKVEVGGKRYTPPEVSAMILQNLKETAENYLGHPVDKAVITVPAYFNDSQRKATKDAGTIAGLEVQRIINEPTAAALAFGLGREKDAAEEKVAVFDFGGGTFDISLLEIASGVIEVKATNGDTHLGGDDVDELLLHHVAGEFKKEHGIDLRKDKMALQRLKEAAEQAKKELSSTTSTTVNLPFITADSSGPKHLTMTISRAKFEELARPLFKRCEQPCKDALRDAGWSPAQVDRVLLVGGSTRIPAVRELTKQLFGREPSAQLDADLVVSMGAAIQGGILGGAAGFGKDETDLLLLDVTPLSLGIETRGGVMTPLVERNTTIPVERKNVFTTAADHQTAVTVHVLQGERQMAGDNRTLGMFNLEGLPPAPAGVPQIEVTFDIDANGILNVTARDLGTGKDQKIRIESSSGLSEADIDRMKREAEEHKDEDAQRRKVVEAQNEAESHVYSIRNLLKEHGDKISADEKGAIETAIASVEKALEGGDLEALDAAKKQLLESTNPLSMAIYKAEQAKSAQAGGPGSAGGPGGVGPGFAGGGPGGGGDFGGAPGPGGGSPPPDDDQVIDAEFTTKDE